MPWPSFSVEAALLGDDRTWVELLLRRGALDKAARACADAIELMEDAGEGRHAQTIALFRDLRGAGLLGGTPEAGE